MASSSRWRATSRLLLLLLLTVGSGCRSVDGGVSGELAVPAQEVFAAAARALQGWPRGQFDRDQRVIQTGWVMWRQQPTALLSRFGGSHWTRVRIRVEVDDLGGGRAGLSLRAHCQERPPAGRRAYRWQPVTTPSGYEQELADSIHSELGLPPARAGERE